MSLAASLGCICRSDLSVLQVIVDDYVQSEAVLKASRMHHELDLDGALLSPSAAADSLKLQTGPKLVWYAAGGIPCLCASACADPGCSAVYLTGDLVIAATRDTMDDTITFINEKYGSAWKYLKAVSPP